MPGIVDGPTGAVIGRSPRLAVRHRPVMTAEFRKLHVRAGLHVVGRRARVSPSREVAHRPIAREVEAQSLPSRYGTNGSRYAGVLARNEPCTRPETADGTASRSKTSAYRPMDARRAARRRSLDPGIRRSASRDSPTPACRRTRGPGRRPRVTRPRGLPLRAHHASGACGWVVHDGPVRHAPASRWP